MNIYRTREPDFEQLVKVLKNEKSDYPVLFELFMNGKYLNYFSSLDFSKVKYGSVDHLKCMVDAYYNAGYVHASTLASEFLFPKKAHDKKSSVSLNDSCMITDWESFESYPWMDPEACDYSKLKDIEPFLPGNMKLIVFSSDGVLENTTALLGYDNLCYMIYEEEELVEAVFNKVGEGLLKYYQKALEFDSVGAIIVNDDWGFNTQTFLSTEHMRKYVFPWHKKIVEAAHAKGKYAILHSCGYMGEVFDDIIDDMKYDAKHSFEDNIIPIEESLKRWGNRIALLGGLDIDFFIRSSVDEVVERATKLIEYGLTEGGYAVGTGNSMCDYIPEDKAVALMKLANNYK